MPGLSSVLPGLSSGLPGLSAGTAMESGEDDHEPGGQGAGYKVTWECLGDHAWLCCRVE